MRELVYKLIKEDYQDWIHWNVKQHYSEKARKKTIFVFVALTAAFVLSGIFFNKSILTLMPTLLIAVGGGMFILKSTSFEGQVKMVWKRSGLDKLEKSGNYPIIHLQMLERGMRMIVENQNVINTWGYKDILGAEETERLFLIETVERTWQFVAKSAFEDRAEMDAFLAFLTEKVEAAKADPEAYTEEEMLRELNAEGDVLPEESAKSELALEESASEEIDFSEDNVVIEHVDTSNMGKIGKMAHIMAAMAASEEEESNEEPEQEEITAAEEQVKTEEV